MDSSAYERGIKAASAWRRLSNVYLDADTRFTSWADSKGIPGAIGKSLVPFSVLILLSLALVAGFVIGAIIIAVAGFAYMFCYIQLNTLNNLGKTSSSSSCASGGDYRNGNDGDGFYSGPDDTNVTSARLDKDEDDD